MNPVSATVRQSALQKFRKDLHIISVGKLDTRTKWQLYFQKDGPRYIHRNLQFFPMDKLFGQDVINQVFIVSE
jgi:hypothetical protein